MNRLGYTIYRLSDIGIPFDVVKVITTYAFDKVTAICGHNSNLAVGKCDMCGDVICLKCSSEYGDNDYASLHNDCSCKICDNCYNNNLRMMMCSRFRCNIFICLTDKCKDHRITTMTKGKLSYWHKEFCGDSIEK